jgi:hypothetical protein
VARLESSAIVAQTFLRIQRLIIMFTASNSDPTNVLGLSAEQTDDEIATLSPNGETDTSNSSLIGIDEVQKALNRSRASV